ncbi:hypothetical protein E2562_001248 [Oryza meyeriana var. granulata]|uniref:F-box domain-containing protein n=1 Tax=Oryza meyeriana var. granulata TaxID=110450 RepID=A0A6G1DBA1_9ORYZ|nr:hypothetical protein E2562_001248 [Oryza meyeriana var. granulata]
MTAALPDDVLAEVLRHLAPRWLAASSSVCKSWRDVVDGRRLLRTDLLLLSLAGIFANYIGHDYSELFSRPTTGDPISGKLDFLPSEDAWCMVRDHCNGLLLLESYVVNPATRRWVALPPYPPPCRITMSMRCL